MFPTTRWTLIQKASDSPNEQSRYALEELCQQYAAPIFGFIRSRVKTHQQAEDATQDFFAALLNGGLLRRADAQKGRFRTFLQHAVRGFLADQHDYDHAVKRGGRVQHVTLEPTTLPELRTDLTAEDQFDLQWVHTVLQSALSELQSEYAAEHRRALFAALGPALDHSEKISVKSVGQQLRMTESAVRVALHRMRRRLGQIIRQRIHDTVGNAADVDDEINDLMQLLETRR